MRNWFAMSRDISGVLTLWRALTLSAFDPFTFNLRIGIAAASAIAGDYGEAARIVREVLDKNPRVTWAYRVLAGWSALAGDLDVTLRTTPGGRRRDGYRRN